jgi:hypothetical protein
MDFRAHFISVASIIYCSNEGSLGVIASFAITSPVQGPRQAGNGDAALQERRLGRFYQHVVLLQFDSYLEILVNSSAVYGIQKQYEIRPMMSMQDEQAHLQHAATTYLMILGIH